MIIAFPQVKAIFEEVLKEFGEDHVYRSLGDQCLYFSEENPELPGCAVGQIIFRINKDAWETCINGTLVIGELFLDIEKDSVKFTEPAKRYLMALQSAQDSRVPWGEAHRRGIKAAKA